MLTPEEIDALPEYTLEQQLKLVRHEIMKVTQQGQAYGINGRQKSNHRLAELRGQEAALVQQINDRDCGDNDGRSLAVFGTPR